MSEVRKRLTFANVVSVVALFVALGGSAIAINKIKANSVGSKQIKAGAVNTDDLADNSVTSPKVANGSLLEEDFAAGQVPTGATGPRGPEGTPGQTGATGPQGIQGPTGTVNTSNFYDKAASDARFLGIGATAANASAIGGTAAAAVPRSVRDNNLGPDGSTRLGFARRAYVNGTSGVTLLNVPSVGSIVIGCGAGGQPIVAFQNGAGANEEVWIHDMATTTVSREVVTSGSPTSQFTGATTTDAPARVEYVVGTGDTTTLGTARLAVFEVGVTGHLAGFNNCQFQVQSQSFTN